MKERQEIAPPAGGDGPTAGRRRPSGAMLWLIGFAALNLSGGGILLNRFFRGDRTFVVPGAMTRGHYPIETQCNECHTPGLGVSAQACLKCHRVELDRSDDSHPATKFTDPRNADRLAKLDARSCVACHVEHRPASTRDMGVTQPVDVCKDCHAEIAKERPSHEGFAFSTCENAGCHNFHDNRALNEQFIAKHLSEPAVLANPHVPAETRGMKDERLAAAGTTPQPADAPSFVAAPPSLLRDWSETAHARANVDCMDCHRSDAASGGWAARPGLDVCRRCHDDETKGFLASKHGMRLAVGLSPMTPAMARLPMRTDSARHPLGCSTCHEAHRFDRQRAAVDACLGCHDDDHSRAYKATKHFGLWQAELAGKSPAGTGVSCATCHLPREIPLDADLAFVRHDQSAFIRPDEKMVSVVCKNCHGLGFALDAIADLDLIKRGVDGQPAVHVESLGMVGRRVAADAGPPPL